MLKIKEQVGTGDSERIRTYNFPQSRLTDHKLIATHALNEILSRLNELLDALEKEKN